MASRQPKHVKPMVFPSQLARRGRGEDFTRLRAPDGPPAPDDSIVLRVTDGSRPDAPGEVVIFRQPSVTVGRSRSCDHRLDDLKHVVSGQHARFSIEDGGLFVTDLGSRNFTYLDGQRLEPGRPYELDAGSTVKIAEFEIQADAGAAALAPTEAPTVFEPSYQNPFREEAARLAEVLARLGELYEAEPAGRREDALDEALEEALGSEASGEGGPAEWISARRGGDDG